MNRFGFLAAEGPVARRVGALYTVECSKAIRQRQTYTGPVLVVLVILLAPLAHPLAKDGLSDYGFIAYVTPLALNFLGYILLLIFVGGLVASEIEGGTLRGLLLRPVRRSEIYMAKLLVACSYATVLTLAAGVTCWALATAFGELRGIQVGGELLYTSDDMAWAYIGGSLLALLPQWAGACVGLLYSTLSRSTAASISLSIGTWIVLDFIKYPLGIDRYVFTTYLDAPWRVFTDYCDGLSSAWFPMFAYCLLSSVLVGGMTTALGLWVFNRRNLGTC